MPDPFVERTRIWSRFDLLTEVRLLKNIICRRYYSVDSVLGNWELVVGSWSQHALKLTVLSVTLNILGLATEEMFRGEQ